MKLFILVTLLSAIAIEAEASPAVGDQANYEGNWRGQQISQAHAFLNYDSYTQQFKQLTITRVGSNPSQSSEKWVHLSDAVSDETTLRILQNCRSYGGFFETVSVPAGTFDSCRMLLDDGGYVWVGVVPFGVVKIERPVNGSWLTAWLTSYLRGR